jgi:hypothetical protein
MTETVNVLPHLNELKDAWRKQDFKFTNSQQEQYDILIAARRERVRYFYDTKQVFVGSRAAYDKANEITP